MQRSRTGPTCERRMRSPRQAKPCFHPYQREGNRCLFAWKVSLVIPNIQLRRLSRQVTREGTVHRRMDLACRRSVFISEQVDGEHFLLRQHKVDWDCT